MKLDRNSKAAAVLVGGMGLTIMTGGTAYAYWTTTGTGTGTASATTVQPVTVTATADSLLYPGGSSTADLVFSNPNRFAVTVISIAPSGPVQVSGGLPTQVAGDNACAAGNAAVTFAALSDGAGWVIPGKASATAPNGTRTVDDVVGAVAMGMSSANRCQSANFSQAYTFTAESTS